MGSRWPITDLSLDQLDLDLRNVRIPASDLDESAIANYLVEAEDLLELARDILRDGYLDNELPVVVKRNGRYVVMEGNRRVTVLKAIHDPALLGRAAARMDRLKSRYPDEVPPTEIRVMIAPSRADVQPLLARLHTRNPKKSWMREQQAVFYHAQLSDDVTVDDLRSMYPGEASQIASFIRMGEMREVIRGLRYDDAELEDFVKASKLKMTAFEYAYDLPKIQGALGLQFDRDGRLVSKRLSAGQRSGLIYLLERFRDKTLNTRSGELKARSAQHDPFVELLRRVVDGGQVASGDAGSTASGSSGGRSGGGSAPDGRNGDAPAGTAGGQLDPPAGGSGQPRGPNRGETRSRLDFDGFEYQGSSAGLRRRFEELRRLDVGTFPNAVHDLLRTVLECAIKDYFATQGSALGAKTMLQGCVEELARAFQSDNRMTALINPINRKGKMPAGQFAGTAFSLNVSNHEPDSFVRGPDVHEAWERIKPILREIVGTAPVPDTAGSD